MRPWLFLALAAACRPQLALEGPFRCDDGVSCPAGLVCVAAHCIAPEDPPGDPDAAPVDAPAGGADLGPFGPAELVAELNSPQSDDDPTLTGDLLEVYFESNRPDQPSGDLWRAVRASADLPFEAPTHVDELSSLEQDGTPEVSLDGLTIYFHSRRAGGAGGVDVYRSSRPSRDDPWDPPMQVAELCTADDESAPWTTADDVTLVFGTGRPGGLGAYDLWTARRPAPGEPFGEIAPWPVLNSTLIENEPWLDPAMTLIYFTSDRAGGAGGYDLWIATRSPGASDFGEPVPAAELNGPGADGDAWLSPDLHTIYFSRNPGSGADIYRATR